MQTREQAMLGDLQIVTDYFGEEFAPADPTRIMRTVRDFLTLFEKALADIKAGKRRPSERQRRRARRGRCAAGGRSGSRRRLRRCGRGPRTSCASRPCARHRPARCRRQRLLSPCSRQRRSRSSSSQQRPASSGQPAGAASSVSLCKGGGTSCERGWCGAGQRPAVGADCR